MSDADVRDALQRFYEAMNGHEVAVVGELFSNQRQVLIIGTGGPWSIGRDAAVGALAEQFEADPAVRFEAGDMTVEEHGDVAWVAENPRIHLADGTVVLCRHTAVLTREDGAWRVAQSHLSVPEE